MNSAVCTSVSFFLHKATEAFALSHISAGGDMQMNPLSSCGWLSNAGGRSSYNQNGGNTSQHGNMRRPFSSVQGLNCLAGRSFTAPKAGHESEIEYLHRQLQEAGQQIEDQAQAGVSSLSLLTDRLLSVSLFLVSASASALPAGPVQPRPSSTHSELAIP